MSEQERNRRWPRVNFRSGELAPDLRARTNAEGIEAGISEVARRDLGRYYAILQRSMPHLSDAEWMLLCDVLNGTLLDEQTVPLLWAEVSDALEGNPALAEKWGVDGADLVARLRRLSYAELLTTVDRVERFWLHESGDAEQP